MIDILVTDFDLILFEWKHYIGSPRNAPGWFTAWNFAQQNIGAIAVL
jgi:hypothetical protein